MQICTKFKVQLGLMGMSLVLFIHFSIYLLINQRIGQYSYSFDLMMVIGKKKGAHVNKPKFYWEKPPNKIEQFIEGSVSRPKFLDISRRDP